MEVTYLQLEQLKRDQLDIMAQCDRDIRWDRPAKRRWLLEWKEAARQRLRGYVLQQEGIHAEVRELSTYPLISRTRRLHFRLGATHRLLYKTNHAPHTAVALEAYAAGALAASRWLRRNTKEA